MTATTPTWMHHQLARARPILAAEGPGMLRIVVASVAIPLALFGPLEDGRLAFVATGSDVAGTELERQPVGRPVEAVVPDEAFEAWHWSA